MKKHNSAAIRWGRWLGTFVGFPLAGVAARLAVGNIDGVTAGLAGGAVGGAVLGAVQAMVGGIEPGDRVRWTAATAAGLAVGLSVGAATVGYRTDAASLVAMGAITGAAVGLAQSVALAMRAVDRLAWIVATPLLWAGGWLVTSQVIVDVARQHAVFGSSGALAVSALAGVLVARRRRPTAPDAALALVPSQHTAGAA